MTSFRVTFIDASTIVALLVYEPQAAAVAAIFEGAEQ
jgi:uncharacterized protein with PIN domain